MKLVHTSASTAVLNINHSVVLFLNNLHRINMPSPRPPVAFNLPFSHLNFRHWEREGGRFILWGRIIVIIIIVAYVSKVIYVNMGLYGFISYMGLV